MDNQYPFNLIRVIYQDERDDKTHTDTTYLKGLYEQLETLDETEQSVLSMRYKDGLTLNACGNLLGLSASRIRQITGRAMRKLRHGSRSKHYEAIPRVEIKQIEHERRVTDQENERLKGALRALGGRDVDPHVITMLASMIAPEDLDAHISALGLNNRAYNGLMRSGFTTVKDIITASDETLYRLPSIGEKSMREIKTKIKAHILLPDTYQIEKEHVT